jgi:hypothetical protein
MLDFKNNKYIMAMLAWGIVSWGFLVYKFWAWVFRFAYFEFESSRPEFPVTKNRFGNSGLDDSERKPTYMDWELPEDAMGQDDDIEVHILELLKK